MRINKAKITIEIMVIKNVAVGSYGNAMTSREVLEVQSVTPYGISNILKYGESSSKLFRFERRLFLLLPLPELSLHMRK